MGLEEAVKKFTAGIEDLARLEVTTYTGSVESAVSNNGDAIDWAKFTPTSGKLVLVAATLIRADGDTVTFRASQTGIDDMKSLVDLHMAAVESAKNGRLALLELVKGLVKIV